jgi:uncharacterized delta-60 repeat protein
MAGGGKANAIPSRQGEPPASGPPRIRFAWNRETLLAVQSRPVSARHAFLPCCAFAVLAALAGTARAADGDPDPSFSGDGVAFADWAGGPVQDIRVAVNAQGSVLVGGTITRAGGDNDFAIARFHGDGAIDTGFGYFGYRTVAFNFVDAGNDALMGVFPLADGKVMLLGRAEVADEIVAAAPAAMARLTAAGNVDASFGDNGRRICAESPWPSGHVYFRAVARQNDGKFLFGGYCVSCGSGTYRAVVLRTGASGDPDATFGNAGWGSFPLPVTDPRFGALHVDAQGRIVLGGTATVDGDHYALVARMTSAGDADTSFGPTAEGWAMPTLPGASGAHWNVTSLAAADRDGALYLGLGNYVALAGGNRGGVARLDADGSLDTSYGSIGVRELTREDGTRIDAIAARSDDRLLAAGRIDHTGGGGDFFVARLRADGAYDTSFDGNGVARHEITTTQDDAQAMTLAAGKPVIAGHTYQANASAAILRLQSDLIFADGLE